ncbi:phosphoglucan phosphatase LSF1, chloroplastic-like isoform X2 [Phragmites australis]|uniref:phosphoglucan phosphatase LSF1, chloroplastic-like isoform X2 n=1 Tax=Phragmites australis TaxID=29695 RepID=UPI002D7804C1|nr:phosphoglucan phosphatase LSF1, chloroplastic-like isoform X2 [Phragmites australis]
MPRRCCRQIGCPAGPRALLLLPCPNEGPEDGAVRRRGGGEREGGPGGGGWRARARGEDAAQRVHGRRRAPARRPFRARRRRPRLRSLAQERGERGEVEDHHGRRHPQEGGRWRGPRHHQRPRVALRDKSGPCSLVLERPFAPFPIHELHQNEDYHILFNRGRVPIASWNSVLLSTKLNESSAGEGKSGFAIFSPRMLSSQGLANLSSEKGGLNQSSTNLADRISEIVGLYSDEDDVNAEWAHGSFPLEEYIKALDHAKDELYYNHSLGMQYSKITEQIFVGSCVQTKRDVKMLSETVGITAVLNFQSESERINWGINSEAINNSCRENNILMVNYPIREVDSMDLRKKLPFCVGLLLRLIRKNYRIYVTCTTGYDRSPACVISYLHWVQDTPLHIAHKFITGLHSCRPDRAAIVWATWDLIALVENGRHDGSPTHSVCFVWNSGREGEDVELVGDFTSNWKDKIKCNHKGGSRYEAEVRLRHGKYYYKFIVGGQWRHSTSLPTETDEHRNVNNVIRVGDIAQIRPAPSQLQIRDPTVVKVIERALTEDERFSLAFAARRMAFAICPIRLSPKQ